MSSENRQSLRIMIAQIKPRQGDLEGNSQLIKTAYHQACAQGAQLVIFPEMALTGYPLDDLVLDKAFAAACQAQLEQLCVLTSGDFNKPALLLGAPRYAEEHCKQGKPLLPQVAARALYGRVYNSCFLIDQGRIAGFVDKRHLPNYGVFNDQRLFCAGEKSAPLAFRGFALGVMICEDFWFEAQANDLSEQGADVLIAINASVYSPMISQKRLRLAQAHAERHARPCIYVNKLGAKDHMVFDGGSFALNSDKSGAPAQLVAQCPAFESAQQTLCLIKDQTAQSSWLKSDQTMPALSAHDGANNWAQDS